MSSCASVAALWITAEYENSPLANLKAFGWDRATIIRFLQDFENFCEAEQRRTLIKHPTPGAFDFDDVELARTWSEHSRERLCRLSKTEKEKLAYFIGSFISKSHRAPSGPEFIHILRSLLKELVILAREPAQPDLDQLITGLSDANLKQWASIARESTRKTSICRAIAFEDERTVPGVLRGRRCPIRLA